MPRPLFDAAPFLPAQPPGPPHAAGSERSSRRVVGRITSMGTKKKAGSGPNSPVQVIAGVDCRCSRPACILAWAHERDSRPALLNQPAPEWLGRPGWAQLAASKRRRGAVTAAWGSVAVRPAVWQWGVAALGR